KKNSMISKGGGTSSETLAGRTVIAERQSGPLLEDVRVINKVSQNLHAEIILRTLGHERGTAPTLEGGLAVMRTVLDQAGIMRDEYSFFDGSGMSRENLVTPRAVTKLLQFADSAPWAAEFRSTLPVAG